MYVFVTSHAFDEIFPKLFKFFLKNMIFFNYRKILMISVDLGLQFVPQVFSIFEKRILSAQRTFGRSTENDFLG